MRLPVPPHPLASKRKQPQNEAARALKIRALLAKAQAGCEGKITAQTTIARKPRARSQSEGAKHLGQLFGQVLGDEARAKAARRLDM